MAQSHSSSHQGGVKDPENDGRLKENREAARTKGTTPGSEKEHGREPAESSHSSRSGSGSHSSGSHSSGSQSSGGSRSESSGESSDLKSREYKDAQGNIHHHTRTYQEQHGKK